MSSSVKSVALVLFVSLLILVLFAPLVYSQSPRSYISSEGKMGTSYKLSLYSPNEETTYKNSLLLNFTLRWTYDLMPIGDCELAADYAYSIDDNPFVGIVPTASPDDQYAGGTDFVYNPSFYYTLNISNLTNGQHTIVIKACFYFAGLFLNDSSTPFTFTVNGSTPSITPSNIPNPTPTSSIPEFSIFPILPLFMAIILVATILLKRNKPAKRLK